MYDLIVIGGGPAGLAAACAAWEGGLQKILIVERDKELGGILNQCIHNGFGLHHFKEELTGPEYAGRFVKLLGETGVEVRLDTMVLEVADDRRVHMVGKSTGYRVEEARSIVLAMGCRERTRGAIAIPGTRPAGVFTAGAAQRYVNMEGWMPGKRVVILGSGDIGLIMARRMTLEGAKVLACVEVMPYSGGLNRNIVQCLHDYEIPLYLSHTVTRVLGAGRLTAVEVAHVDGSMRPIPGTEEVVECDGLILSVGLIPENELAQSLGVELDPKTKGPVCDGQLMTSVDGVFSCGNALHVNDLVDYVSESGELAGRNAARYAAAPRRTVPIRPSPALLYAVPQRLDLDRDNSETALYFRSREVLDGCVLRVRADGREVFSKRYPFLRPPEIERLNVDFSRFGLHEGSEIELDIEVTEHG